MTTALSGPPSTRGQFLVALLLGVLLGAGASWGFGFFAASYHPSEESKLCYDALTNYSEKLHPQTREYLKSRLYWNAAVWMSVPSMSGWKFDFGPVDDSALAGVPSIKDATSSAEVYRAALTKHGITPKSR